MKLLLSLFILGIGSLAAGQGLLPISQQIVPNALAIVSWQDIPGYQTSSADPMRVERVKLNCDKATLYPTHPQQNTKLYHVFRSARYDHTRLKGGDEACILSSKFKNARGELSCLRPDILEYAVISDLYSDSCGNIYRGFWDVAFLKANDNMGVLFAKGRTLYPKPDAQGLNDMYIGETYPVDASEFLFLSPLSDGDYLKMTELVEAAGETHSLENLIWKPRF